ncbi:MAG: hypothetical protein IKT73_00365 [Anaerotignum sp.]|nr:hypothetical protein [Anaerotignum sp.]
MKKRLLCMLLACSVGLMPVSVFAEETEVPAAVEETADETTEEEETFTFGTMTASAEETALPDGEMLYEGSVEKMFYGGGELELMGIEAGKNLEGDERLLYKKLVPCLREMANGERGTTTVSFGQSFFYGGTGVEYIPDKGIQFGETPAEFDLNELMNALISDLPYELYWFDKAAKQSLQMRYVTTGSGNLHWLELSFKVTPPYQDGDVFSIDTEKSSMAAEALERAEAIVENYEDKSDYEKIIGYYQEICKRTDYDKAAAESGSSAADNGPWQMLYVFDGKDSTKVVCEGYSKAFQYLMDRSVFDSSDTKSYLVSGMMQVYLASNATPVEGGLHMWNVVTLNGRNYLMDVTNSEAGSVGEDGSLMLAGTDRGSLESGYVFVTSYGYYLALYGYFDDMFTVWDEDVLTLATSSYSSNAGAEGVKLTAPTLIQAAQDMELNDKNCPEKYVYYTDIPGTAAECEISIYDNAGNLLETFTQSDFNGELDECGIIPMGVYAEEGMQTGRYTISARFLPGAYTLDTASDRTELNISFTRPAKQYEAPTLLWTEDGITADLPELSGDCWLVLEVRYTDAKGGETAYFVEGTESDLRKVLTDLQEVADDTYQCRLRVASADVYETYHSDWSAWVTPPQECDMAWAAAYDAEGRMLACTVTEVPTGTTDLSDISLPEAEGAAIGRIFSVSCGNLQPNCGKLEKFLP